MRASEVKRCSGCLRVMLCGFAVRKPSTATTKPRLLTSKKPAAKKGGLGVSKMTTKVDDSLFEQAPAEEPTTVVAGSLLPVSHCNIEGI